TCKCAEKDMELLGLRVKQEETITALTKGHADIISHLTAEFQSKLAVQSETAAIEQRIMMDLVQSELESRLDSAFRSLDSSWAKQKKLIAQEHTSLIEALRAENDKAKAKLEAERASLAEREKILA